MGEFAKFGPSSIRMADDFDFDSQVDSKYSLLCLLSLLTLTDIVGVTSTRIDKVITKSKLFEN